jgi:hypothetical protein
MITLIAMVSGNKEMQFYNGIVQKWFGIVD